MTGKKLRPRCVVCGQTLTGDQLKSLRKHAKQRERKGLPPVKRGPFCSIAHANIGSGAQPR